MLDSHHRHQCGHHHNFHANYPLQIYPSKKGHKVTQMEGKTFTGGDKFIRGLTGFAFADVVDRRDLDFVFDTAG